MIFSDCIKTLIFINIIVSIYILKTMTNLKNILYVDKEMQDIMKKFYQIKRNLIL